MKDFSEIKNKLTKYCVYQDRCHYEVEQKLREYYYLSEDEKADIIIYLIQNNFLNEERFANNYTKGKFNQKQWGKIKIKTSLYKRNITEKLINSSLSLIDNDEYYKNLRKLALNKKQLINENNSFMIKKKLYSYLSQKGYESDLIYDVMNDIDN